MRDRQYLFKAVLLRLAGLFLFLHLPGGLFILLRLPGSLFLLRLPGNLFLPRLAGDVPSAEEEKEAAALVGARTIADTNDLPVGAPLCIRVTLPKPAAAGVPSGA